MGSAASFAKAAQDASDVQIRAALGDLSPEDLAKVHQVQLGGNCGAGRFAGAEKTPEVLVF